MSSGSVLTISAERLVCRSEVIGGLPAGEPDKGAEQEQEEQRHQERTGRNDKLDAEGRSAVVSPLPVVGYQTDQSQGRQYCNTEQGTDHVFAFHAKRSLSSASSPERPTRSASHE